MAGFSMVFASGALAPVAAASFSVPSSYVPSEIEAATGVLIDASEPAEPREFLPDPVPEAEWVPMEPAHFDALMTSEPVPSPFWDGVPVRVALTLDDPWADAMAEASRIPAPPAALTYAVVVNEQVQAFIERFTGSRRDVVGTWLDRSGRYLAMIKETLRRHDLPEDLAFVPMIESGFNPLAVSRAGAKGLWQFMAGTARGYGLRVDQWVDERLDPEKSTAAAAAYFRDLYRQFGSWALAKAAYNAGHVKIMHAMRRVGSSDFWTLAGSRFLLQETKEFVPAIHAATVIGRDPERFGFDPAPPEPLVVETVTVPPKTSLAALATRAKIPVDSLQELNPVLIRGVTPPGQPYALRVPAGSKSAVLAALAPRPAPARGKRPTAVARLTPENAYHVVQPRETLTSIARKYGVSVSDLARWNALGASADRIHPGDRLRVVGDPVRTVQRQPASGPAGDR